MTHETESKFLLFSFFWLLFWIWLRWGLLCSLSTIHIFKSSKRFAWFWRAKFEILYLTDFMSYFSRKSMWFDHNHKQNELNQGKKRSFYKFLSTSWRDRSFMDLTRNHKIFVKRYIRSRNTEKQLCF